MNLDKNICVVVFGYNRPSHLRRLLISLENYKLKKIYFFLDGPKNKFDKINQKEILLMIKKNPFLNIKMYQAKKNLGLKKSIENGLKVLSKKYNFAIVFEDDCIPRKEFFKFTKLNLKHFNSNKYAAICGYLYKPLHKKFLKNKKIFTLQFSNFCPWGYCINLNIWSEYQNNKKKINKVRYPKDIILDKIRKITNSKKVWTLNFMTFCKIKKYNFLYPSRSLIKNIGFDGSGLNSKITDKFNIEYHKSEVSNNLILYSNNLNKMHETYLKNNIKYFY